MTEAIFMMKAVPQDVANEVMDRTGGMRLNNVMKGQVVEKALAHAFDKREAALLKEEHAIAKACFITAFGTKAIAHLKGLGEPFAYVNKDGYGLPAPTGTPVQWWVGGQQFNLRVFDIPIPRHLGRSTGDHGKKNPFSITMEKHPNLVQRCRDWQDEGLKLTREKTKVATTLNAMLQGISTYKSLEKNWPEGRPFYKHLPKDFPFRHQVPATLVSELNKALGV